MTLKQDIQSSMKAFMKDRNTLALGVVRMVWSAIRKFEIDSKKDATDDDVLGMIQKEIKSLDETLIFLEKDNRLDAIQETVSKISILKEFLPQQLTSDEVREMVLEVKLALNVDGPSSMGKMMAELMPKLRGRCDGKLLSQIVREVLGG